MQRPDIIFIVLDTQRADRLGAYGYKATATGESTTPNLDRFAGQGAVFEQAISPAQWTIPSHASMFTGLYPTAHQVTQSNHTLGPDRPHLAEVLRSAGYQTIGFCNNPLVGVLNNGFKRGFHTFYNYGGAIPSMPQHSTRLPWPLNRALEGYTQFLRRISYPIQNFFGRSDLAFRLSLNAWLTPFWSKLANFKGQNARSVRDVSRLLLDRERREDAQPLFLFLNLMETHLPFWPPGEFVDRVAPYLRENREARNILRRWNREAYRWAAPLVEPLGELESQVLSDMYDAEVAYQDDYLGQLFTALAERSRAQDTLTVIVADHGDSLGEHNYFGHAFVAYQELVQVPLVLHWPRKIPAGKRVETPVSTRRVYHTLLDAVGVLPKSVNKLDPAEIHGLTLMESVDGSDPEQGTAYSEIYPPLNFAKAIEHRQPELLEQFRCLAMRRAVVKDNLKLIQVDEWPDELFNLARDPLELNSVLAEHSAETAALNQEIGRLARLTEAQRANLLAGASLQMDVDDHVLQRLRGLGYIE
jgi:arylsulfatase A-like enzyme